MRSSDIVELDDGPAFEFGEKVRLRKTIRNDGTFPLKDVGEVLATKGETGYVAHVGTFLQQFYIYGVYLPERGITIGCKAREIDSLDHPDTPGMVPSEKDGMEGKGA